VCVCVCVLNVPEGRWIYHLVCRVAYWVRHVLECSWSRHQGIIYMHVWGRHQDRKTRYQRTWMRDWSSCASMQATTYTHTHTRTTCDARTHRNTRCKRTGNALYAPFVVIVRIENVQNFLGQFFSLLHFHQMVLLCYSARYCILHDRKYVWFVRHTMFVRACRRRSIFTDIYTRGFTYIYADPRSLLTDTM